MNACSFQYRFPASLQRCVLAAFLGVLCIADMLHAQVDLLPLEHPATTVLERLYYSGVVPDIPVEHFPISRKSALEFLRRGFSTTSAPDNLRRQALYYTKEISADMGGDAPRAVVIPVSDSSVLFFDDPFGDRPFTGIDYSDTVTDSYVVLDPVLDGEFRYDAGMSTGATILQGGARLRGTLLGHLGFSAQATNGTVLGDKDVVLADPRYGKSFKLGIVEQNSDIDFGSGYVRADFDNVSAEIGREPMRLGAGGKRSLLMGAQLPSNYDHLRFQMRLGKFSFTHVHASVLSDPVGISVGVEAEIPQKYVAAHLFTIGPFAGVRASIGEAVVYSGRSFELGYLNPLNFLKSQEHYLRDRDNSYMYCALSANPVQGLFVEGEFMLDDLVFSRIGDGYWGNKTAWRVGARATGWPLGMADAEISYTRLEPYVYSHFNVSNAYVHDGTMLAASGLEPNSDRADVTLTLHPLPNLSLGASGSFGRHGANEVVNGNVVRNVGGDVRRTFDSLSSSSVEFLDGTLEESVDIGVSAQYEFLRNMYVRAHFMDRALTVEKNRTEHLTQLWLGLRIGSR